MRQEESARKMDSPIRNTGVSTLRKSLCIFLLLALFLGVGVFDHSIWSPAEPAVAGIVWNMVRQGQWVVPTINDIPYLEKPPLTYWLSAACCRLGGSLHPGWIRLPSAWMGLGVLGMLALIIRRRYGGRAACVAALFGATSVSIYGLSRQAGSDMTALFCVCACYTVWLWPMLRREASASGRWKTDAALAVVLALSFYAKNFYSYLLVLPPILVWVAVQRDWIRMFRLMLFVLGASVVAILPWAWALFREGGLDYLRVVFVDNTLGRFLSLAEPAARQGVPFNDAYVVEKEASLLYYVLPGLQVMLPWTPLFLAALVRLFQRKTGPSDGYRRFLQIAAVTIPVVLTLSSSKSDEYIYPIFFVFLLILMESVAGWMADSSTARPWEVWLAGVSWVLVMLVMLALPVGAAWLWQSPWMLAGWAISLPAVLWIARRLTNPFRYEFLYPALSGVVLLFIAVGWVLFPWLDTQKSDRPFFDQVRPALEGRTLYTTQFNDRLLPLINYYVDQPVLLNPEPRSVFDFLRWGAPCGVFISVEDYEMYSADFAVLPHDIIRADKGRSRLCFVATPRSLDSP